MIETHAIPAGLRLHPLRDSDLTASDIGAAIGIDPYKSQLRLYGEKTGLVGPQPDNPAMAKGRWMEPAALEALQERHPTFQIRRPRVYIRDPDLHIGCTPDALIEDAEAPGELINCQVKTVARPVFEREWKDGPPLHYELQTLTEGYLLNADRSIIAAFVTDTFTAEIHEFPVARHEAAEAKVRQIARDFWQNVREGKQPATDYSKDADVIAQMFPRVVAAPPLDLSADNRLPAILVERESLLAVVEGGQTRIDAINAEIREKLGGAEAAELPGWRITCKEQHRKEHLVRATSFRKLLVTKRETA